MTCTNKKTRALSALVVILAAFTWGFTMLSRTSLSYFLDDIGLSAAQAGAINFATSTAIFCSTLICGRIADRTGRHELVLTVCIFIGSVFLALTATTENFVVLLIIRFFMGVGCGPMYSLLINTVQKLVPERRFSICTGVVTNGESIINTMLGASITVALLNAFGWRTTDVLLCIPLVLIGVSWLLASGKIGRASKPAEDESKPEKAPMKQLIKNKNILICIFNAILTLTCSWCIYVYAPSYWKSSGGLEEGRMSLTMSAMGIMMAVWCFVLPLAANKFGRKAVELVFSFIGSASFLVIFLAPESVVSVVLFALFGGLPSVLSVFAMAIIPPESVGLSMRGSAVALVNGLGEMFGAAVGPLIAGFIADSRGIASAMLCIVICLAVSGVLCFVLSETNPNRRISYHAGKGEPST